MAQLKVKLVKSLIGSKKDQIAKMCIRDSPSTGWPWLSPAE